MSRTKKEIQQDKEANEFALSLLMPEKEVIKFINKWYSIEKLCDKFGVDEVYMNLRLFSLWYIV